MKFRPLHDRVVVKRIEAGRSRPAASSFRTLPRRSRRKERSSPLGPAAAMRPAS
jgi:co-chaperonin GroES (HSP10)